MKCYYDFHIHSALSPCGDMDNTPNNIVNMAALKGLNLIAVADHNSMRNGKAAAAAGRRAGVTVLPAMELTTAEDVHMLCLFSEWEGAEAFAAVVQERRMKIPNKTEVFGEQAVMDEQDEITGYEPHLLTVTSHIPIIEAAQLVRGFCGVPVPAHMDKAANGILETLGGLPEEAGFTAVELSKAADASFLRLHPELNNLHILRNSDAHYLWDISEARHFLELNRGTPQEVISFLQNRAL